MSFLFANIIFYVPVMNRDKEKREKQTDLAKFFYPLPHLAMKAIFFVEKWIHWAQADYSDEIRSRFSSYN